MRIGILGTGNMGRSLGVRWARLGHDVFFGSSDAARAEHAAQLAGDSARAGTYEEAAAFGEVIVHTARATLLTKLLDNTSQLDGKIVVETNNGPVPGDFRYEPQGQSFTEQLQADVPNARVVKAFNTMAQEVFEIPPDELRKSNVSVFLAGDDRNAKEAVSKLAGEMGFQPVDFGAAYRGRLLEELGDIVRWGIAGLEHGPFATINFSVLNPANRDDLGGRQASRVDA